MLADSSTSLSLREHFSRWYSKDQLDRLDRVMLRPPQKTICRVNTHRISVENALVELQDFTRKQCLKKGWPQLAVERIDGIPDALAVEMTGPHAVQPTAGCEIIVDKNCGAAVLRGADIFIGGIIAATLDVERGSVVSVYVDIDGKCLRGRTSSFDGRRFFVGCGISQVSRADVFCTNESDKTSSQLVGLKGIGILMTQPIFRSIAVGTELAGKLFLQNLPSILVGHALSPRSSDSVLDMCAAPGGKTSHLACLMNGTGELVAFDKTSSKVQRIENLLETMGLENRVKLHTKDATKCIKSGMFAPESFDRILLDPPCSGIGQRPQFCWDTCMSLSNLNGHASFQRKLLSVAIDLMKPGSYMVYSTCTINPEENEENVAWVLDNFAHCIELCDLPAFFRSKNIGVSTSFHIQSCLNAENSRKVLRFDPVNHDEAGETIGFFIAKFRKKAYEVDQ